jgi:hypothetical protein
MLLPLLPIVWTIAASAYWWRRLAVPLLFAATTLFAIFGIQSIVSFAWDYLPMMSGNYAFYGITSSAGMQRHLEEVHRGAMVQSVIVFIVSIPFLWWLKNGLSRVATGR